MVALATSAADFIGRLLTLFAHCALAASITSLAIAAVLRHLLFANRARRAGTAVIAPVAAAAHLFSRFGSGAASNVRLSTFLALPSSVTT